MTATRADAIRAARSWVGTPYQHAQCVKGAGIDCGFLLIKIYSDLGLIPWFDPRPYPPDWHLHRAAERYLGFVEEHAREVPEPGLGDVLLFKVGRCFSHGGIVTGLDPFTLVHAHYPARRVVEDRVDGLCEMSDPARYPRRAFTLWA